MDGLEGLTNLAAAALRLSAPLILAAMGGLLSYQAGLVNISLEGLMVIGAFVAVVVGAAAGSAWVGVLAGVAAGMALAALFALFVTRLRANLIITGLAVNFLAAGATAYLLKAVFGNAGTYAPQGFDSLPTWTVPGLSALPVLGPVLFDHSPLVYAALLSVPLVGFALYRTIPGMQIRAVGENIEAARTAGVPVTRRQYAALLGCGALCGLAGAHLAVGDLGIFRENMVAGRGFIALAAVYFAAGRPGLSMLACLLFGLFEALQFRLQLNNSTPPQFFQMLPYLMVVIMLVAISVRKEWRKGWS
jgi:ABC-type uncharacterized transport system permease subunit